MFSGLIAHAGRIAQIERLEGGGVTLYVDAASIPAADVLLGDSIAVDGVCLTVTSFTDGVLHFDVVPETLNRSTLGALTARTQVNLELSLRFGDRLGGHLVYGHVDTHVRMIEKATEGQGYRITLERPANLRRYLVEKGYVGN